MEQKWKVLSIGAVVSLLIVASVLVGILVPMNLKKLKDVKVAFIPEKMKSCPGHTAWLLTGITFVGNDPNIELSVSVETNTSIPFECLLWNTTSSSRVLEIFLYPDSSHINRNIEVRANITANDLFATDFATIEVINWTTSEEDFIESMRDTFVSFLSTNHPSFGINETVHWEGFWNAPSILVVGHYLFKSDYWEMEVSWHVMIAPHDWVKVYLRPRGELAPTWGGMIESWSNDNHSVVEVEPPSEIFR